MKTWLVYVSGDPHRFYRVGPTTCAAAIAEIQALHPGKLVWAEEA
jgi:hypothetical protein